MRKIFLILAILLVSSCVSHQGTYTVLSNKIVNIKDFQLDKANAARDVKGKDVSHRFLVFFQTKDNPNLSDALNNAFKKADGDIMTDVTVTTYWWTILIYGQYGWVVEGDVVKTRQK